MKQWICALVLAGLLTGCTGCWKRTAPEVEPPVDAPSQSQPEESLSDEAAARAADSAAITETVEGFMEAFLAADFETAGSYTKAGTLGDVGPQGIEAELQTFMQKLREHISYTVAEPTIDGDTASVDIEVDMIDLSALLKRFVRKVAISSLSGELTMERLLEQLEETIAASQDERQTIKAPFKLERIDGQWLITDSEDLKQEMLGKLEESGIMDLVDLLR